MRDYLKTIFKSSFSLSIYSFCIFIVPSVLWAQEAQTVSSISIDTLPRKIYFEEYDKRGDHFSVELYEETREGVTQLHFRSFKNGKILSKKSAEMKKSYNFSYVINETSPEFLSPKKEGALKQMLRELIADMDQALLKALSQQFNGDELAQKLSSKIKTIAPRIDEKKLAKILSQSIQVAPSSLDEASLAKRLSSQIKTEVPEIDTKMLGQILSQSISVKPSLIDELALQLSLKIKPTTKPIDTDLLARLLSGKIIPAAAIVNTNLLAEQLSGKIIPAAAIVNTNLLAEQLSGSIKPAAAIVNTNLLAEQLSGSIKPAAAIVDTNLLAEQLSGSIKPAAAIVDANLLAEQLSGSIKPAAAIVDANLLAEQLSGKIIPAAAIVDANLLAEQLSGKIKPAAAIVDANLLAEQLSGKIKPSPIDSLNLSRLVAKSLIVGEKIKAKRVEKYPDLIKRVTALNITKNYAKSLDVLDEDVSRRTPEEQRRLMKMSGLMSVLSGLQKLKKAISLIAIYDLDDDVELRQITNSLDFWVKKNLVTK